MKPGDHPEFFRLPPPPGRSRESTIELDAEGRFWHDGEQVTHPGMARAFASWIARHPDDGRFILTNGYDWSYFSVADAPFFVESVQTGGERPVLGLSDGSEEPLEPSELWVGERDALYTRVKQGAFVARFQPRAQLEIAPLLVAATDGVAEIELGGRRFPVPVRSTAG
ncbi:MAG TPA: hypothetical protein VGP93_09195 [Polyangiaceae bacterium]|nr:hypothetical protein [Polyangiaceae bacterium]